MSAHTPGPWVFVRSNSDTCEMEVFSLNGDVVAGEYGIDSEADARLIASAPELLEALQMMVVWYAKRDDSDEFIPIESQDSEVQAAMRAIDKAEGRV